MENVGAVKELCKLTVGVHLKVVKLICRILLRKGLGKSRNTRWMRWTLCRSNLKKVIANYSKTDHR